MSEPVVVPVVAGNEPGITPGYALLVLAVCLVIAIGALNRMPYGYYTIVRVATVFAAVALAFAAYQRNWKILAYVLGGVGLLYNPIIPVHLDRRTWFPINFGTIALLALSVAVLAFSRVKRAD